MGFLPGRLILFGLMVCVVFIGMAFMDLMNRLKVQVTVPALTGLESAVGNTPLLRLKHIPDKLPQRVQIAVKAEWFNPGGSIKDRPALNILTTALNDGSLSAGKRLLDSTSGNMGISYATFAAALNIPVTLVVPANASPERLAILRALGTELILSDPLEGSEGARLVARRLASEQPERYFYANQYDNPANWQAHYLTTAPEIIEQTGGQLTHFVAGLGTTGTLVGSGRGLRQFNPNIQIIAVQPDSPFHGLEGLKHLASSIQPGIYDPALPDRTVSVSTEQAQAMTRQLARQEGLFVGVSSGAAVAAALTVANELAEGLIVVILPDAGYKYLSEKFWGDGR
ncbi:MAG: cysteine synthase family protein [Anaerolineaceae bacterium]|nr:cysteine synthase family protein [Anaerolineaceae bacterium]